LSSTTSSASASCCANRCATWAPSHIDQASSGGEAIALLTKIRYDVVLCDYNLGEGKNGQQVLEEARVRNLLLPSSVWMMVSAEKSVESVMGAAEHQPDAYLIKPITEGVLLTR
jgi:CheY-like chemotaxis protein